MLRLLPFMLLLLAHSGCSSTKVVHVADNDDREGVVCVRERVTGSLVPRKVCRTESQIAREREASQKMLQRSTGMDQATSGN